MPIIFNEIPNTPDETIIYDNILTANVPDETKVYFPNNLKVVRKLCYICTFTTSSFKVGIKCASCNRIYHKRCSLIIATLAKKRRKYWNRAGNRN